MSIQFKLFRHTSRTASAARLQVHAACGQRLSVTQFTHSRLDATMPAGNRSYSTLQQIPNPFPQYNLTSRQYQSTQASSAPISSNPSTAGSPQTSSWPTEISTLPNGIRIASQQAPGHFVTAGVYVDTGSRFETDLNTGAAHVLDRLGFKSTAKFTMDEVMAKLEGLGGNVLAHSSREAMIYQAAVFHKDLPNVMELLAETTLHPSILPEEVDLVKEGISYEVSDMAWKLDLALPEKLQQLAFGGLRNPVRSNPKLAIGYAGPEDTSLMPALDAVIGPGVAVGRPMLCMDPAALQKITPEVLKDFHATWFTPDRLVVAGVGMAHKELRDLAEKYFGGLKPASEDVIAKQKAITSITSKYTGGIAIVDSSKGPISPNPDDRRLTSVFIGFEAPSVMDPDVYALATLATLMGGGGSFSAGGPGKGMYTRLYTEVLNQYHWIESCNIVNFSFMDTGLFGITATVPPSPEAHRYVISILCHQLVEMTYRINPPELSRAKNQLKSNLLMSLESRSVELEDLGRQVLARKPGLPPRRIGVEEMCRRVDALTAEDLMRVARRVVLGENVRSPLEFEKPGSAWFGKEERHWVRTGDGSPTVLVCGPLKGGNDAFFEIERRLEEWGLAKPSAGQTAGQPEPKKKSWWG